MKSNNLIFDEVYGSIYYSNHGRTSSVYIENIVISTSQINDLDKDKGVFDFGFTDYAYIRNLGVEYHYDMVSSCEYHIRCKNPVSLIKNYGQSRCKSTNWFIRCELIV